jgi:hypothetical protein
VFVSSTYEDLREERAVVISALLQMDCFPAGMELFPASDQDSWSLIKSVIEDSDYYLVIPGGRYGSVSESAAGRGYTDLEYEYALSKGKPAMALVHANPRSLPGEKIEQNDEGRRRFDGFRAELRQKNCRHWSNLSELTAGVFISLLHLKKTRPAVGWIRSTDSGDEQLKDEVLSVRRELEAAKLALQELRRHDPPPDSEKLAKGRERTEIAVAYPDHILHFECNWAQVISCLLPLTLGGGADEDSVHTALFSLAKDNPCLEFRSGVPEDIGPPGGVLKSSVGRVMNQLVALGFIEGVPHPSGPGRTLWRATPYGAREGCLMVADLAW